MKVKRKFNYFNDTYRAAFSLWVGDQKKCLSFFSGPKLEPLANPGSLGGWVQLVCDKSGRILQALIWVHKMEFTTEDYANLAHECLHAAEKCLQTHNVRFGETIVNEPLAYLFEAIYSDFLDQLHKEYKRKRKRK